MDSFGSFSAIADAIESPPTPESIIPMGALSMPLFYQKLTHPAENEQERLPHLFFLLREQTNDLELLV